MRVLAHSAGQLRSARTLLLLEAKGHGSLESLSLSSVFSIPPRLMSTSNWIEHWADSKLGACVKLAANVELVTSLERGKVPGLKLDVVVGGELVSKRSL